MIALILGVVLGSVVNIGLIIISPYFVDFPDNLDPMNAENWSIKLFIFPFLAHGIGTLAGAFTASKISKNYHIAIPLTIGFWFLAGGIYMVAIMPAPIWFVFLDIGGCYLPMAWLGWNLSQNKIKPNEE